MIIESLMRITRLRNRGTGYELIESVKRKNPPNVLAEINSAKTHPRIPYDRYIQMKILRPERIFPTFVGDVLSSRRDAGVSRG